MRAKAEHRFAVLAVALLICTGCKATHQRGEPSLAPAQVWPGRIMGLQRQYVASSYVLYGNAVDTVDQLRKSIDEELTAFRDRYDCEPIRPGLVLVVDDLQQVPQAIADWREENGHRQRWLVWTSRHRSQFFATCSGRPYCLEYTPYFCESFSIPRNDAIHLGIVNGEAVSPEWICCFPSDEHISNAFDEVVAEPPTRQQRARIKQIPLFVRVVNFWVPPILRLAYHHVVLPKWREIDLRLAELQRRETLWTALMPQAFPDEQDRAREIRFLREQIDREWQELWLHRPRF